MNSIDCRIREIHPGDREDIRTVAKLHMELLNFGPMAGLGELFIREICYAAPMRDGLLKVALYEVNGQPAGFAAYTSRSISFHRSLLRNHWLYASFILGISILANPRRLIRLGRAIRVALSRRAEQEHGTDPLAEVVCLAVRPDYLTPAFILQAGLHLGENLISHAATHFHQAGFSKMRMIPDADNTPALLFYHRLGAQMEAFEQAGEPRVQVWFDLETCATSTPRASLQPSANRLAYSTRPRTCR